MRLSLPVAWMAIGCAREAPETGTVAVPTLEDLPGTAIPPAPPPEGPDLGPTRAVNDRDLLPAALDAIAAAEREVSVAMFVIYGGDPVDTLLDALGEAASRGVRVRLLADEEGEETEAIVQRLSLSGVEARLDDPRTTLHNKLIVADAVAIVGSHNWTWSALSANHEGSVLVADAEVAGWYARWFDLLWDDATATPELAPLARADLQPLADRSVLDAVLGCIDGTSERADVVMYAIAWDERYPGSEVDQVLGALESARGRGVAVRVIVDASAWTVDNAINDAAIARLRSAGIEVWRAPSSVTTHAKVLRCDETVLVSDANWSYSGLALTHGTSLLATTPALLAEIEAWMDEIRAASTPVE